MIVEGIGRQAPVGGLYPPPPPFLLAFFKAINKYFPPGGGALVQFRPVFIDVCYFQDSF